MTRLLFRLKTALYPFHVKVGAQMATFCNYELPMVYKEGHMKAHKACREDATFFDVSHMLQTAIRGKDSVKFLEKISCGDINELKPGQALYTLLLNKKGTIIDDAIVQKIKDGEFYLVSNAGFREKVGKYLMDVKKEESSNVDISEIKKSLIAVQGPTAVAKFEKIVNASFKDLYFMNGKDVVYQNTKLRVTRCGYTGEDGVEVSIDDKLVVPFAEKLVELGVLPAGLGARDSLRLESGLCLYGSDIDETTTILEASLLFAVGKRRRTEGGFLGYDVYKQQKENGVGKKRIGITVNKVPARGHAPIKNKNGEIIGEITSGCPSPTLKKNIAMCYLPPKATGQVEVRGKLYDFEVAKMPFLKQNYYRPSK